MNEVNENQHQNLYNTLMSTEMNIKYKVGHAFMWVYITNELILSHANSTLFLGLLTHRF